MPERTARILLAEDNPGDVLLFREALRSSNLACELSVAQDGEKALQLLEKAGMPDSNAGPDLIVLDINLPKRTGQEVLRWIRGNPGFASVPVMILTSSASPDEKTKATALGADLYLQKSSNLDEILAIGAVIQDLLKGRTAEH